MSHLSRIKQGMIGGVAGGVPFGAMMGMMGMLPMIGSMVGRPSATVGFAVHLMMSAAIGALFGLFVGPLANGGGRARLAGLGYGAAWWVLGPLTFMPWIMGMGLAANWSAAGVRGSLPSLVGHLVFGLVLGVVYHRLESTSSRETGETLASPASVA